MILHLKFHSMIQFNLLLKTLNINLQIKMSYSNFIYPKVNIKLHILVYLNLEFIKLTLHLLCCLHIKYYYFILMYDIYSQKMLVFSLFY